MRIYHEAKVTVPLDGVDTLRRAHVELQERQVPEDATIATAEVIDVGFGFKRLRVVAKWHRDEEKD